MSETHTIWHKYSSERPPKTGHFLITAYKYVDGRNRPSGEVQLRSDLYDNQVPLHVVLSVFGQRPLFGNRKPGGKKGETFWMVFFKTKNQ